MAYWADVFEVRINSGGISQKGGRGGKKDCEIGIRVVVVFAVEGGVDRCHDLSDLDCERLTRGCNEADTPLWENCENQQQQRTTTVTVLTIYLLRQYFHLIQSPNHPTSKLFFQRRPQFPLPPQGSFTNVNVLWTFGSREPRLARILRQ
jgi:hypothetical protein